jgi:hypothetical protein
MRSNTKTTLKPKATATIRVIFDMELDIDESVFLHLIQTIPGSKAMAQARLSKLLGAQ